MQWTCGATSKAAETAWDEATVVKYWPLYAATPGVLRGALQWSRWRWQGTLVALAGGQ